MSDVDGVGVGVGDDVSVGAGVDVSVGGRTWGTCIYLGINQRNIDGIKNRQPDC